MNMNLNTSQFQTDVLGPYSTRLTAQVMKNVVKQTIQENQQQSLLNNPSMGITAYRGQYICDEGNCSAAFDDINDFKNHLANVGIVKKVIGHHGLPTASVYSKLLSCTPTKGIEFIDPVLYGTPDSICTPRIKRVKNKTGKPKRRNLSTVFKGYSSKHPDKAPESSYVIATEAEKSVVMVDSESLVNNESALNVDLSNVITDRGCFETMKGSKKIKDLTATESKRNRNQSMSSVGNKTCLSSNLKHNYVNSKEIDDGECVVKNINRETESNPLKNAVVKRCTKMINKTRKVKIKIHLQKKLGTKSENSSKTKKLPVDSSISRAGRVKEAFSEKETSQLLELCQINPDNQVASMEKT